MNFRRPIISGAGCAVSLLLVAPAFAAEGSWTSSLSGILPPYSSRTWVDRNSTTNDTTIRFRGCRYVTPYTPLSNVTVQVTYENTWTPDENLGQRNLYCTTDDWDSWGRLKAGNHHFTVVKVDGTTRAKDRMSASYVGVAY